MYFKEYIKELGSFLQFLTIRDDNWSVTFGNEDCRIFRSSSLSDFLCKVKSMVWKTLQKTTNYAYYKIDTAKTAANEDTAGPLLVLAPSTTEATNRNVTIYVQASDKSGVAGITYLQDSTKKTMQSGHRRQQLQIIRSQYLLIRHYRFVHMIHMEMLQ